MDTSIVSSSTDVYFQLLINIDWCCGTATEQCGQSTAEGVHMASY